MGEPRTPTAVLFQRRRRKSNLQRYFSTRSGTLLDVKCTIALFFVDNFETLRVFLPDVMI